jgi:hypothetical protein
VESTEVEKTSYSEKIMSVSYKHRSSHFLHLYIVNYIIGLDDIIFDKLPDLERRAHLLEFLT